MYGQEAGDSQMWSLEEGNIISINTRPGLCYLHVSTDLNQIEFGHRTTFQLRPLSHSKITQPSFSFHKFIFYYLHKNAPSVLLDTGLSNTFFCGNLRPLLCITCCQSIMKPSVWLFLGSPLTLHTEFWTVISRFGIMLHSDVNFAHGVLSMSLHFHSHMRFVHQSCMNCCNIMKNFSDCRILFSMISGLG